jgi:hypothetical protein
MHLASVLKYWTVGTQAPCAQKIVRKPGTGFDEKFTSYLFELKDIEDVSMQAGDGYVKECANLKFPKTEEDDQLHAQQL